MANARYGVITSSAHGHQCQRRATQVLALFHNAIDPVVTMWCETVAVGCHRLRVGLFRRFSSGSLCRQLPLVRPLGSINALSIAWETLMTKGLRGVQPSARRVLTPSAVERGSGEIRSFMSDGVLIAGIRGLRDRHAIGRARPHAGDPLVSVITKR